MADTLVSQYIERIDSLIPQVRARAAQADIEKRLDAAVVRVILQSGLFKLWVPRHYGGAQLALPEALQVYAAAAIAMADELARACRYFQALAVLMQ